MTILEQLKAEPWFERTRKRGPNFAKMVEHVLQKHADTPAGDEILIVETGCARNDNNWEGDGHSTYIWDWLAERVPAVKVHSLDIDPESIKLASAITKHVEYHEGDSVKSLLEMDLSHCWLLYLDSFDWSPQIHLESSFHHMQELTAAWRAIPSGCLVAVDDRHGEQAGKHFLVDKFMTHLGLKPVFMNCQIGWVKP